VLSVAVHNHYKRILHNQALGTGTAVQMDPLGEVEIEKSNISAHRSHGQR